MSMYDLNSSERALIDYYRLSNTDHNYQDIHLLGSGFVKDLESKLVNYYEQKYCLCVNNATTALLGIWLSLGVKKGDLILTSPISYPASIAGMLLLGAIPYFVDIEAHTLSINPDEVAEILKHIRKIKAVLSTDFYGIPADTKKLKQITQEFNIPIISDSAQSFGSKRDNKPGGYFADAIVISFGHHKCNFAGEGGAILTNSRYVYEGLIQNMMHPEYQKIKVSDINEFALNGRISPYSAIVANSNFNKSLSQLKLKQKKYLHLIDIMNRTSLIEPIEFKKKHIIPSFYRLSCSWGNKEELSQLTDVLFDLGYNVNVYKDEINLLYDSCRIKKLNFKRTKKEFSETENQVKKRFIVTVHD
jgi:dTDP-4-amino-4,6-dideoxygalactose transaminase